MHTLYHLITILHIGVGALALVIFWLPVFARKGSAFHRRAGRWFAVGMYTVALSGLAMASLSLISPLAYRYGGRAFTPDQAAAVATQVRIFSLFLLMLSTLVFVSVRHAVLVMRAKSDRRLVRGPVHVGGQIVLGVLAIVVGVVGVRSGEILLMIFAVVGTLTAAGMLRYTFKASIGRNEWWLEHLGGMIGGGIGAYTAFFAFGGRALFADLLSGHWQVLPWVMPGVIGTVFIVRLSRHYRKRFSAAPATDRA